jgi:hypothetical protein
MVHCGYEPAAVAATFGSLKGLARTIQRMAFPAAAAKEVPVEPLPVARPQRVKLVSISGAAANESRAI